jgi:hypothetical protein
MAQALADVLTGIATATGARLCARTRQRHYEMAERSLGLIAHGCVWRSVLACCGEHPRARQLARSARPGDGVPFMGPGKGALSAFLVLPLL